jgi:tetratricopeptide (TPR) repeat protein
MTTIQIIMMAAAAFFAWKVFEHIQGLDDTMERNDDRPSQTPAVQGAESLIEQADEAYETGDLGGAKALLAEADVQSPDNPEILNKLAFILGKEGDVERAIEHYEASLQVDDQDDIVHNAIASLLRQQGEFERAKTHYEQALAIDSEYAVTYFNYANLLLDMEEKERAKVMYEKALKYDPDMLQAKFELEKLG